METSMRRRMSAVAESNGRALNAQRWPLWPCSTVLTLPNGMTHRGEARLQQPHAYRTPGIVLHGIFIGQRRAGVPCAARLDGLSVSGATVASSSASPAVVPAAAVGIPASGDHLGTAGASDSSLTHPSGTSASALQASLAPSAAAGIPVESPPATAVGPAGASGSSLSSVCSSFEEMSALSSSSIDTGEVCTLVADVTGDVQMVCESDPAHPISLAERAVLHPIVPPTLLQDIEARLEADLQTVAVTILFAVGFISLEFGVSDLIDHYWGDSLLADVVCVALGLAVVFWVRLSKLRLMRFDRWR